MIFYGYTIWFYLTLLIAVCITVGIGWLLYTIYRQTQAEKEQKRRAAPVIDKTAAPEPVAEKSPRNAFLHAPPNLPDNHWSAQDKDRKNDDAVSTGASGFFADEDDIFEFPTATPVHRAQPETNVNPLFDEWVDDEQTGSTGRRL